MSPDTAARPLAAIFPLAFAALHEATGGWQAAILSLGVLFLLTVPTGIVVARTRTLEEEWEMRHGAW